jgi:hypothetical protein
MPPWFPMAPPNRDAEDYYLKGRFYSNQPTPEGLNLAVDSFSQPWFTIPITRTLASWLEFVHILESGSCLFITKS